MAAPAAPALPPAPVLPPTAFLMQLKTNVNVSAACVAGACAPVTGWMTGFRCRLSGLGRGLDR